MYSETASFIINRDRELKILGACQLVGCNFELPSWSPDWTIDVRHRPIRPFTNWDNEGVRYTYNATGDSKANVRITGDCALLTVQGVLSSRILTLGTRIGNEAGVDLSMDGFALFKSWWPLAKNHTPPTNSRGERRIDTYWRCIIADMSNGEKAQSDKEGVQFRRWMANYDLAGFEQEDLSAPADLQDSSGYMTSFQQATTNRRFFINEDGSMGVGPLDLQPGDLVCLLLGSQVPFVLRLESRRIREEENYMLLGECYCHGIMEGEGLRCLADDGSKTTALRDFVVK